MTNEQAYIEGFCKAAEAAGVDPVELYKFAGIKDRLAGLGGEALARLSQAGTAVSGAAHAAGGAISDAAHAAKSGISRSARRYLELLRGGNPETLDTGRQLLNGTLLNRLRMRLGRTIGIRTAPEISRELRKSLATQVGTGVAATGGVYGGYKALSDD